MSTAPPFALTPGARKLILEHEVGGPDTYSRLYARPEWPGVQSGITIGIGYDCGYNTADQIRADWGVRLPVAMVSLLVTVAGLKGSAARAQLARVRSGVTVPLQAAMDVLEKRTVPRFWQQTMQAFPGIENLPADCQGALLSLVYNRGPLIDNSDRRREMLQIRQAITAGKPELVPGLLRAMIRIWRGTSIEGGMARRRRDEANLFAVGLNKPSPAPVAVAPPTILLQGHTVPPGDVYQDAETSTTYVWARAVLAPFGWQLTAVERSADKSAGLAVYSKPDGPDADTKRDEFDLPLLFVPGSEGESIRGYVSVREAAAKAGLTPVYDPATRTVRVGGDAAP